jgi:hypothetical protein
MNLVWIITFLLAYVTPRRRSLTCPKIILHGELESDPTGGEQIAIWRAARELHPVATRRGRASGATLTFASLL